MTDVCEKRPNILTSGRYSDIMFVDNKDERMLRNDAAEVTGC